MGMTSAAEAKLDARIRPEITALRARTSYPKRHRSFSLVQPGAEPDEVRSDARPADDASASNDADLVREVVKVPDGVQADSERTSVSAKPSPARPVPNRVSQSRAATARRTVPEGPIRLTRRGRIVVGALVVIGAAAGASLLWLLVASQAHASSHVHAGRAGSGALARVVVRPGQTLWSIASAADPAADPRVIIQEIVDENSLAGTSLRPGQVLLVPRG